MRSFLSTVVLATIASHVTAQTCYSTDGQELDSRYKPCYPQAESSACCMLNGTQGENQQNDICLDSGLCQATSGWYAGFLYINGCTDQSGKADGCPQLCSFSKLSLNLLSVPLLTLVLVGNQYSWSVLQCEPGKFCCRAASDTENCCNNNQSIISTSHIGSLLLPGSTAAVNTTFNATADAPTTTNVSSSDNSTCASTPSNVSSSTNATLIDRSQCPADKSATVGGAVGGILGAALIGAIVALVFALRGRKQAQNDLHVTQATLTATETQAAEEKAHHQKQLEEQQRYVQTMPPNYPSVHHAHSGGYPARPPPPNEMDSTESHAPSELSGVTNGSRVELTGDTAKTQW